MNHIDEAHKIASDISKNFELKPREKPIVRYLLLDDRMQTIGVYEEKPPTLITANRRGTLYKFEGVPV